MEQKLVIISAPSGAGKTTITKHLLKSGLNVEFSVSATTRALRGNETDGKDYFFLSVAEFKENIRNDKFVEWQEVYKDLLYGTMKSELERIWANGNHVLFDVDVNGGINLKKKFGADSISIFIMPPSVEELEKRLVKRATDTPEKIRMRIEKAKEEIKLASQFDIIILNNNLDDAKSETYKVVLDFIKNNRKQ